MTEREHHSLMVLAGNNLARAGLYSLNPPPPYETINQAVFIEPQPYQPPPYQPVKRNNLHRPDDYKRGLYFAIIAFIVVTIIGTPLSLLFTIPALCLSIWAWKLQEQEHYRSKAKAMMISAYALDVFAILFVYTCFFVIYGLMVSGVFYRG